MVALFRRYMVVGLHLVLRGSPMPVPRFPFHFGKTPSITLALYLQEDSVVDVLSWPIVSLLHIGTGLSELHFRITFSVRT
jgi:hypothetical protein